MGRPSTTVVALEGLGTFDLGPMLGGETRAEEDAAGSASVRRRRRVGHPGGLGPLRDAIACGDAREARRMFDSAQHSEEALAQLRTMMIKAEEPRSAFVGKSGEQPVGEATDGGSEGAAAAGSAPAWHAARRRAILADPKRAAAIRRLHADPGTVALGTLLPGLAAVAALAAAAGACSRFALPLPAVFLLAYTVGAVSKIVQFAVGHEICHGTAGSYLRASGTARWLAFQVFSLPSLSGTSHAYFENQHLGHHASLGSQALVDLGGTRAGSNFDANLALMGALQDGDLLAVGSLTLGRVLLRWRRKKAKKEGQTHPKTSDEGEAAYPSHADGVFLDLTFSKTGMAAKVMLLPFIHIAHHFGMATLHVIVALFWNPVFCAALWAWPGPILRWFRGVMGAPSREAVKQGEVSRRRLQSRRNYEGLKVAMVVGPKVALHVWVVAASFWLLMSVAGGDGAWRRGALFLILSEMFQYGFLFHPFMGIFCGSHRSRGNGFESKATPNVLSKSCQPTMSTYGWLSNVSSLNLGYHVEHHDFPCIPWWRLPRVHAAAPEFYAGLERSSDYMTIVWKWILHSESWTYSCQ